MVHKNLTLCSIGHLNVLKREAGNCDNKAPKIRIQVPKGHGCNNTCMVPF